MTAKGRFDNLELGAGVGRPEPARGAEGASVSQHLEAARKCLDEGRYEEAMRRFSWALSFDQKREEAWLGQVLCLIELGEYKEASTWADHALGIHPSSANLVAAKAVAFGRLGDFERAIGFSDAAMKLDANDAFVWWARGDVLILRNRRTATYCFAKAVETARDNLHVTLSIGKTLLAAGLPDEAEAYFRRALSLRTAVAWLYLGHCLKRMGRFKEATEAFDRALQVSPTSSEARKALNDTQRIGSWRRLWSKLRGTFR